MFKKQQTLLYKISAIVFILLLLTPCTIKADIKASLNITTSTVNKDRVSSSACSSFSQSETRSHAVENSIVAEKTCTKLLGRDKLILPSCAKTLILDSKKVSEDVNYYSTPIFIHFRELII